MRAGFVRVVEEGDVLADLFEDEGLHLFGVGAGVADGRALLDAGGEGDGVGPQIHQFAGAQSGLFARAAAAVDEADKADLAFHAGEYAGLVVDSVEVGSPGAVVLSLLTAYDTEFHGVVLVLRRVRRRREAACGKAGLVGVDGVELGADGVDVGFDGVQIDLHIGVVEIQGTSLRKETVLLILSRIPPNVNREGV